VPGPYTPTDSLIGPIATFIANLITTQIPSITHVYPTLTDRAPSDNAVVLRFTRGKIVDETNGKIRVVLTYTMNHLFRRAEIDASLLRAYAYAVPWMRFLAAIPNQALGGLAISMTATDLATTQVPISGQPTIALVVDFNVHTEFNLDQT